MEQKKPKINSTLKRGPLIEKAGRESDRNQLMGVHLEERVSVEICFLSPRVTGKHRVKKSHVCIKSLIGVTSAYRQVCTLPLEQHGEVLQVGFKQEIETENTNVSMMRKK